MSRIPTENELQKYLNEHNVEEIMTSVLENICFQRPNDIPTCIVDFLCENYPVISTHQEVINKKIKEERRGFYK